MGYGSDSRLTALDAGAGAGGGGGAARAATTAFGLMELLRQTADPQKRRALMGMLFNRDDQMEQENQENREETRDVAKDINFKKFVTLQDPADQPRGTEFPGQLQDPRAGLLQNPTPDMGERLNQEVLPPTPVEPNTLETFPAHPRTMQDGMMQAKGKGSNPGRTRAWQDYRRKQQEEVKATDNVPATRQDLTALLEQAADKKIPRYRVYDKTKQRNIGPAVPKEVAAKIKDYVEAKTGNVLETGLVTQDSSGKVIPEENREAHAILEQRWRAVLEKNAEGVIKGDQKAIDEVLTITQLAKNLGLSDAAARQTLVDVTSDVLEQKGLIEPFYKRWWPDTHALEQSDIEIAKLIGWDRMLPRKPHPKTLPGSKQLYTPEGKIDFASETEELNWYRQQRAKDDITGSSYWKGLPYKRR